MRAPLSGRGALLGDVAIGSMAAALGSGRPRRVPRRDARRRLHANGAPGYWLDFKDPTTMWQDTVGATPLTGVAQTVARIRDKSYWGHVFSQGTATARPTWTTRVNLLLATETLATQSVTVLAASYVLRFSGSGTVTLSGAASGAYSAGSHSITCTAGSLTLTVAGSVTQADLRTASDAALAVPSYQRVTTDTDYESSGFTWRLKFKTDDFLVSANTIDLTGTDKVTVFAAVKKMSDAARAVLVEHGNGTGQPGTFGITAPDSAGAANFWAYSRGSALAQASVGNLSNLPAGGSHIVTLIADIAADRLDTRVDGVLRDSDTDDQGTGNFGAQLAYVGARAGTSLFADVEISELIMVGAIPTREEIVRVERDMASEMGKTI